MSFGSRMCELRLLASVEPMVCLGVKDVLDPLEGGTVAVFDGAEGTTLRGSAIGGDPVLTNQLTTVTELHLLYGLCNTKV